MNGTFEAKSPEVLHVLLAHFNASRIAVGVPSPEWETEEFRAMDFRILEGRYIENLRRAVASLVPGHEGTAEHFANWFRSLKDIGPGQDHLLFNWLESDASLDEFKWFLTQDVAGKTGFEDFIAYTQIQLPTPTKIKCAQHYWNEVAQGNGETTTRSLLERMCHALNLHPAIETTVWESLALENTMLGLALNRRYVYHSLGALGVTQLITPPRAAKIAAGMNRLGLEKHIRSYFDLQASVDTIYAESWIREIIYPLVKANPECAKYIAEGALMRLLCGERCYVRYAQEFGVNHKFNQPVTTAHQAIGLSY